MSAMEKIVKTNHFTLEPLHILCYKQMFILGWDPLGLQARKLPTFSFSHLVLIHVFMANAISRQWEISTSILVKFLIISFVINLSLPRGHVV